MFRTSIVAATGAYLLLGSSIALAQSVDESDVHCFVTACDDATTNADDQTCADGSDCTASDPNGTSGVEPRVGKTRGFHLSTGKTADKAVTAPRTGSSGYVSPATRRTKVGASSRVATMAMPSTRKSLDMRLGFDLGSAQLTPEARQQADIFARQLKDFSGTRDFVIEGHTDNIGGAAYNMRLSRERAQAVVDYLVSQGVPRSKLRAVGYGFQHPRSGLPASDPTNRRVEIVRY